MFWFLGDMYTPESGESEPDWVQTEKKQFSEFRDTNKVKEKRLVNQAICENGVVTTSTCGDITARVIHVQ